MMLYRGVWGRVVLAGLVIGGGTGQLALTFGVSVIWAFSADLILAVMMGHRFARAQRRRRVPAHG